MNINAGWFRVFIRFYRWMYDDWTKISTIRWYNWWIDNKYTENVNRIEWLIRFNLSRKMDRVPPFLVLVGFAISIIKSLRNLHDAVFALTPPYELKNIFLDYWLHRTIYKLYGIAQAKVEICFIKIFIQWQYSSQKFTI